MTSDVAAAVRPPLVVNGREVPLVGVSDFLTSDITRATTFISNFGNWPLPPEVAAAFGSPVAHLEWFHATGELVAFGQVPRLGHGEIEISRSQQAVDTVGAAFGTAGGRVGHAADGTIREFFPAMVVDEGTLLAVLAHIAHGPHVHELLWGWHLAHREDDGWVWLVERLARLSS